MKILHTIALLGFLESLNYVASNPFLSRIKRGAGCGETIAMSEASQKKKISLSNYKADTVCSWIIMGTNACQPQIVCPSVNVGKSKDCSDEAVVISDGIGGEARVCSAKSFTKPKIASGTARDLFIDFEAKSSGKGFECEVSCGGKGDPLPLEAAPRKEEFKCVCGLQNKDDRIVGGEDAKMNEFPWQAALVKPGTRQPMCGGSVINNRYILTATHCFWFTKMTPDQLEVLIHAHLLDFTITKVEASKNIKLGEEGSMQARGYDMAMKTDADENTQRFKVKQIIMHDLFTEEFDYDVALLKLDRKIDLVGASAPTPICLPKPGDYKNFFHGEKPTVVGWGLGDEVAGATTRLLQKLDVPVIPMDKCKAMMPQDLTDRMLCAGYPEGGKDACTGDSGGPLSLKGANKQWTQIGIVSWGEGCARKDRPGLYSRVTEFVQWIYHHTQGSDVKWCRSTK